MNFGFWKPQLLILLRNSVTKRRFSTSEHLCSVYDKEKFCEPIVSMEELNKPRLPDDRQSRLHPRPMESWETPMFYRSANLDYMIRIFMKGSDRELIRTEVYDALVLVKRMQYKKWLDEEDEEKKKKIKRDPIEIAEAAILNWRPVMRLKGVLIAGTIYQVPHPLNESQSLFRGLQMARDVVREKCKHGKHRFHSLMANEFIFGMDNNASSVIIQAKQEIHRQCEINRAYSVYRKF